MGEESREERVGTGWGRFAAVRDDPGRMRLIAWAEHPVTERYINRRITGDEYRDWLAWAGERYLTEPAALGLSIACGSGNVERRIIALGLASGMEGTDISEEALAVARSAAGDMPLIYSLVDLNEAVLPSERYDFVVSAAALHHVTDLERCLAALHTSLKAGGLLVLNEYVGPDRFQWTGEQLDAANFVMAALPERYRYNHLTLGTRERVDRRPLGDMIQADPSEAVRSSELLGVVERFFEPLDARDIGGTVLHPALEGIVGNFDEDDPVDGAVLDMILRFEEHMLASGRLGSDFVAMVCRKREKPMDAQDGGTGGRRYDIIARQEDEILELSRRLTAAEEQCQGFVKSVEHYDAELARLQAERDRLFEENAALKSGGLFKWVRFARARLRGGRGGDA
jgi:SAM-dependent methyltransferase